MAQGPPWATWATRIRIWRTRTAEAITKVVKQHRSAGGARSTVVPSAAIVTAAERSKSPQKTPRDPSGARGLQGRDLETLKPISGPPLWHGHHQGEQLAPLPLHQGPSESDRHGRRGARGKSSHCSWWYSWPWSSMIEVCVWSLVKEDGCSSLVGSGTQLELLNSFLTSQKLSKSEFVGQKYSQKPELICP